MPDSIVSRQHHRWLFLLGLISISISLGCTVTSVCGPVPVSSGIRFHLVYPAAKTISLVGTFNNWDPTAHLLSENSRGRWSIVLPLPKGRYQYLFVIDQKIWVPDPGGEITIDDGFGQKNSLLVIE